jgi:hypothetical protein
MEEKKELKQSVSNGNMILIILAMFISAGVGFFGGMDYIRNDYQSTNETELYNLGYKQGYYWGIEQNLAHPEQSSSLSESDILKSVSELLNNADNVDFKVSMDKDTGIGIIDFHLVNGINSQKVDQLEKDIRNIQNILKP